MKTKFTLLIVLLSLFSFTRAQQVPNGDFENWTGTTPTGWHDIDQYLADLGLTGKTLISQETTPANVASGTSSAKLQTQYIVQASGNLTALLSAGPFTISGTTGAITFKGIPYTSRPDSFSFKYKYKLVQADTAQYGYFFTKAGSLIGGITPGYVDFLKDTGDAFHTNTVPITFTSQNAPDSLGIYFLSGGNHSADGNTLWLDDVKMIFNGVSTDVSTLSVSTHMGMFPVPTSAILNVTVTDEMLNNNYTIMDLSGRVITTGIVTATATKHDVSSLPSGTYVYRITSGDNKMLNQAKFVVAK